MISESVYIASYIVQQTDGTTQRIVITYTDETYVLVPAHLRQWADNPDMPFDHDDADAFLEKLQPPG